MKPGNSSSRSGGLTGVSPQIEHAGKAFVAAWLIDNQQRIEPFLEKIPEHLLVEAHDVLIRLEVYMRASAGIEPDRNDYLQRFPDYEPEVDHAFRPESRAGQPGDPDAAQTRRSPADSGEIQVEKTFDVVPERIGRYEIESVLGTGGFGVVCLARDTQLNRQVALKFARTTRFRTRKEMDDLIREAQTAARLEHPGIVAVHDVILDENLVGIVQQFVRGRDLADELAEALPTFERTASLLIPVCQAIAFAHSRGFVHRDIKPANILIDEEGNPHITDFGLAIHESFQRRRRGDQSGTPRYMSPELVRGESHRIDGRSDIWSLGVMLYTMLTGQRPFSGETRAELFDEIRNRDPKPPRQIRAEIPLELERICLRCLRKPVSERYPSARDLAEDLRGWMQDMTSLAADDSFSDRFHAVIPRGLRSFGADDAEYFYKLLPGPTGRNGLPESIRAWKNRIEKRDDDRLQVGLLYGPSGCGKSSFVKAGLIPFLAPFIKVIRIDATAADTEVRLIRALRALYHEIPTELTLPELFHSLREGVWTRGSDRILIVIDQFEQWLHNRSSYPNTELVEALRHCDGEHLQCLLMVRDDFWLATSRFLKALEVDLVEGRNAGLVDLFDKPHAEKVLRRYGRGYGRLQEEPTRQEAEFIRQAVEELAENDRVICVRLSLFAEMFRDKPWTPATLRKAGGISGVGVGFLEDTFSSANARPEHRLHEQAARQVLAALLPDTSVEIRGNMRSRQELLHLSGYANRPGAFADVLRILDNELRLITPTDPEGTGSPLKTTPGSGKDFYQLTHDYLVIPLRIWLNQKQRETMRGRARLRLDERQATWSRTRENRFLPSLGEYLNARLLTRSASWSAGERELMSTSDRYYGLRFLAVAAGLIVAGYFGTRFYHGMRADSLASRIVEAKTSDVRPIIEEMDRANLRRRVTPILRHLPVADNPRQQLNVDLALSHVPERRRQLRDRLATDATPDEVPYIAEALTPTRQEREQFWTTLRQPRKVSTDLPRLRAAAALAVWSPQDTRWQDVRDSLAEALLDQGAFYAGKWTHAMPQVREQLFRGLIRHLTNWKYGDEGQWDPLVAVNLLQEDREAWPAIVEHLESRIDEYDYPARYGPDPLTRLAEYDGLSQKQANIATVLAALGRMERVLPLLGSRPHERTRALVIEQCREFGTDPATLFAAVVAGPDPQVRSALWLALGNYVSDEVDDSDIWLQRAMSEFLENDDPRVHSATEWVLRKMNRAAWVDQQVAERAGVRHRPSRQWRITGQGHTMLRVPAAGPFVMSFQRSANLDYDFEVSAMEVTWKQLLARHPGLNGQFELAMQRWPGSDRAENEKRPATSISWYCAAEYCNWLSEQEGLPPDQWCYEVHPDPPGVATYTVDEELPRFPAQRLVADYRQRSGFRLPLESEWDLLAFPYANNEYHTGPVKKLLDQYEWNGGNNRRDIQVRPGGLLKPGRYGTFDLFGNAKEHCTDGYASFNVDNREAIQIVPGSAYLDPIALRARSDPGQGYDRKLDKGISVLSREIGDHRGANSTGNRHKHLGFRVLRMIPEP